MIDLNLKHTQPLILLLVVYMPEERRVSGESSGENPIEILQQLSVIEI